MKDSWDKVSRSLLGELQVPRGRWNAKMKRSLFHIAFLDAMVSMGGRVVDLLQYVERCPLETLNKCLISPSYQSLSILHSCSQLLGAFFLSRHLARLEMTRRAKAGMPATSHSSLVLAMAKKFSSIFPPIGVMMDSGWNWRPKME